MRIRVAGDEVPEPAGSFAELRLPGGTGRWLLQGVEEAGWTEPTPIQMQARPYIRI